MRAMVLTRPAARTLKARNARFRRRARPTLDTGERVWRLPVRPSRRRRRTSGPHRFRSCPVTRSSGVWRRPRALHFAGDRVGVTWLGYACGVYCRADEKTCERARLPAISLTAGMPTSPGRCPLVFQILIDTQMSTAPLMCAGLIGYRSFRLSRRAADRLYGFSGSSHHCAVPGRGTRGVCVHVAGDLPPEICAIRRRGGPADHRPTALAADAALSLRPLVDSCPALSKVAAGGSSARAFT
jgi:hypothetical protein